MATFDEKLAAGDVKVDGRSEAVGEFLALMDFFVLAMQNRSTLKPGISQGVISERAGVRRRLTTPGR